MAHHTLARFIHEALEDGMRLALEASKNEHGRGYSASQQQQQQQRRTSVDENQSSQSNDEGNAGRYATEFAAIYIKDVFEKAVCEATCAVRISIAAIQAGEEDRPKPALLSSTQQHPCKETDSG